MNFSKLYDDINRSKYPRQIEIENKEIYVLNMQIKKYELVKKPDEPKYMARFEVKGENRLKSKLDVIKYCDILRNDLVFGVLGLKNFNYDFVKSEQLIKKLAQESFGDKITVDNIDVVRCIDKASAGGCLIAKKGTYEGKYKMFDIANSYNKFFIDFKIPTNPKFKTVSKISSKKTFALYRLEMRDKKYLEKEYTMKFKTNRRWFTKWDIDIFNMFDIEFNLLEEENNCIVYDTVDCDFEWMENLNELKQNTDKEKESLKYDMIKNLLSSFWGRLSQYETITDEEYEGETDLEYYYKVGHRSSESLFIHPDKIYKYSCGIIKPFVLAYGRLRVLTQIKKLEDKGYNIVYTHTDSILCNAKDKHFDIGCEIGQWKLEQTSKKGVVVDNIAKKKFL